MKDGIAELRIVQVPTANNSVPATISRDAGMRKIVVNVEPTVSLPPDPAHPEREAEKKKGGLMASLAPPPIIQNAKAAQPAKGFKIVQGNAIAGTGVEYIKGHQGIARLRVKEGLWEQRRGHKVDGGERRRAMVRAKRRAQERKDAR